MKRSLLMASFVLFLLPALLVLALLVLVVENLLANKFYRRDPQGQPEEAQAEGAVP